MKGVLLIILTTLLAFTKASPIQNQDNFRPTPKVYITDSKGRNVFHPNAVYNRLTLNRITVNQNEDDISDYDDTVNQPDNSPISNHQTTQSSVSLTDEYDQEDNLPVNSGDFGDEFENNGFFGHRQKRKRRKRPCIPFQYKPFNGNYRDSKTSNYDDRLNGKTIGSFNLINNHYHLSPGYNPHDGDVQQSPEYDHYGGYGCIPTNNGHHNGNSGIKPHHPYRPHGQYGNRPNRPLTGFLGSLVGNQGGIFGGSQGGSQGGFLGSLAGNQGGFFGGNQGGSQSGILGSLVGNQGGSQGQGGPLGFFGPGGLFDLSSIFNGGNFGSNVNNGNVDQNGGSNPVSSIGSGGSSTSEQEIFSDSVSPDTHPVIEINVPDTIQNLVTNFSPANLVGGIAQAVTGFVQQLATRPNNNNSRRIPDRFLDRF